MKRFRPSHLVSAQERENLPPITMMCGLKMPDLVEKLQNSRMVRVPFDCRVGVISEPEIYTTALGPQDEFIILASDGVWEFVDSQAAVDIVGGASSAEEGCRQVNLGTLIWIVPPTVCKAYPRGKLSWS